LSEVHISPDEPINSLSHSNKFISRFYFHIDETQNDRNNHVEKYDGDVDNDGDFVVPRKKKQYEHVISIVHMMDTSMINVGLQVWRGALLLADFILGNHQIFEDCIALELGSGSGFAGIVLSTLAKRCFLTDIGDEILTNCQNNVNLNSFLFKNENNMDKKVTNVKYMDWLDDIFDYPQDLLKYNYQGEYQWNENDFNDFNNISIIVAADVIYEDHLTDSLMGMLRHLLRGGNKRLYLSLEKRINFTFKDLDEKAAAYDFFLTFIEQVENFYQPYNTDKHFLGKKNFNN